MKMIRNCLSCKGWRKNLVTRVVGLKKHVADDYTLSHLSQVCSCFGIFNLAGAATAELHESINFFEHLIVEV